MRISDWSSDVCSSDLVVEVETKDDVALLSLNRPEKLNAITVEMLDGLLEAIDAIGRSEAIRAAVLRGRGQIGRASGSEGGCQYGLISGDAVKFKKTM